MVMALSKGVGRPIQEYIKNNVLGMVGCMLKVGQYPHIAYGICGEALQLKLDMKGSFTGTTGASGGNSSSNSNSDNTDNNNGDSDGNNSDSENGDANSNSSARNRTRYRSSGSTGSLGESDSDEFAGADSKVVKINTVDLGANNNSELGVSGFQGEGGQTVIIRRIRRNDRIGGSFFLSGDEAEQAETPEANVPTKQTQRLPTALISERATEESFAIPKSKKRGPQNTTIDTEVEFSFFGIIKWGIIIAVLGIFGFFTMSQLNSIRKGWTN